MKNEGKYSTDIVVDYINDFIKEKKPAFCLLSNDPYHCPFDPTPHSKDWDPNDLGSNP